MTIEEYKEEKKNLADKIFREIEIFEKKTNSSVDYVKLLQQDVLGRGKRILYVDVECSL